MKKLPLKRDKEKFSYSITEHENGYTCNILYKGERVYAFGTAFPEKVEKKFISVVEMLADGKSPVANRHMALIDKKH